MQFSTSDLQQRIDALPDVARWQVTNLLLLDKSPMLWFFVRHRQASSDGRFEKRVNDDFLERTFVPASTSLRNYVRGLRDLNYRPSPLAVPYPAKHPDDLVRAVVEHADGQHTMRQILSNLGVDISSHKAVSDMRIQTTTSLSPYLRALQEPSVAPPEDGRRLPVPTTN
jgi:hypothetical protein